MPKIDEIKRDIYSTFAETASAIGYSEIHGRIIAALLASNKKLNLQELAKETGYSISTISLSLELLEFLGMIKKVKKVGDRKLYIELHGDILEGVKKAFIIKIQKTVTETLNRFQEYKNNLKTSENSEKEKITDLIRILEKEVKRLDCYINLLSETKFI